MPSAASASTMTTNTSRCRPGVSSMTNPRYLGRRRDRAQNGAAGGLPAPPPPFGESERVPALPPPGQLPVGGRDVGAGAPPWRTGGLAGRPVPVPAAPVRAQPAEGPLAGAPPWGESGSGGAALPLVLPT